MTKQMETLDKRAETTHKLDADFCIAGGGIAGVCAAITAARNGLKVVLIQDRPVLGGNASSEVRLWALGATSHMGNNNRWAIEGGIMHELFLENLWRNKEGNPIIWDYLLFEKVREEKNITLLLDTAVFDIEKAGANTIKSVRAFNAISSTFYEVEAPLFLDSSGDGIVGFLAGAAFRMGAEAYDEFKEPYAPKKATRDVLGNTIMFTTKDVGAPVKFVAPSLALTMDEVEKIGKFRPISLGAQIKYWWIEYGGHLDTIKDSSKIKEELWRVVYGVWNYIKNSGKFPEAENLTLEWVAPIIGKRESRRFEGDYMMIQQDIIEQRAHYDDVSFGGWALDHHPVGGLYSAEQPCYQWHSKGVYPIPYRTMYSRNIKNLFLGGRIISASHIAFGSTRVMATCGINAQVVAIAAAMCKEKNLLPADISEKENIKTLQSRLVRMGQYIPNLAIKDDLVQSAKLAASSTSKLDVLEPNGESRELKDSWAMMIPVTKGKMPAISYLLNVRADTTLKCELRVASKIFNHTPDTILETKEIKLSKGDRQSVEIAFDASIDTTRYAFVCMLANRDVSVCLSDELRSGILAVGQFYDYKVASSPLQNPPDGIGVESFEFWLPQRRPEGKNFALKVSPPLNCFGVENIRNGIARPVSSPNAWVADKNDKSPAIRIEWDAPKSISEIAITFDADYDHPLEHILMGHPESAVPYCVKHFVVKDGAGKILAEEKEWHGSLKSIRFDKPITTDSISIECVSTWGAPASIFEVRCY